MAETSLRIPQIGEGLQEARLVAVLKQPGDMVKRDEAIYQMETDKAVMDVESPHAGRIVRWLAEPDTILSIGAEVLVMDVTDGAAASSASEAPTTATTDAPNVVSLKIPQIGEGLQEARLVAVLKQPGDAIRRDEAIYQMETDKAVMDVESPFEGKLIRWLAEPDTVLQIGADVAEISVVGAVPAGVTVEAVTQAPAVIVEAPKSQAGRRMDVPPRTRAYAKSKGLSDQELEGIAASGSKLMPEDIDTHLAGGKSATTATKRGGGYSEQPMAQKQRLLMSRLSRGSQLVVPGTMTVAMNWEPVEALRNEFKAKGGDFQPSTFTMFAYAAAKATIDHPMFRSNLVGDANVRTYDHIHLGIAVALPGDELVIAVVDDADTMDWQTFAAACRERIDHARQGHDQANESVTLSLTNMQAFGIRDAVAVVVPPSVATIFLGEPYVGIDQESSELRTRRYANLGITFDHRLINGVGAANFQNAVKANVENIRDLIQP